MNQVIYLQLSQKLFLLHSEQINYFQSKWPGLKIVLWIWSAFNKSLFCLSLRWTRDSWANRKITNSDVEHLSLYSNYDMIYTSPSILFPSSYDVRIMGWKSTGQLQREIPNFFILWWAAIALKHPPPFTNEGCVYAIVNLIHDSIICIQIWC
jgi:hypothetical protein